MYSVYSGNLQCPRCFLDMRSSMLAPGYAGACDSSTLVLYRGTVWNASFSKKNGDTWQQALLCETASRKDYSRVMALG